MTITNRELRPGTRFVAKYKGEHHYAFLWDDGLFSFLSGPKGSIPLDGRRFKSLSAAGSALMGGIACNGWRFWSIESYLVATDGETETAPSPPTPKAKPAFKLFKRTPNQQGMSPGWTRWFCTACMKSFGTQSATPPEECPAGHSANDPELTTTD